MTDRAILVVDRFAAYFADRRTPELIEHTVRALVGQRALPEPARSSHSRREG
jgi:hypothetical protein